MARRSNVQDFLDNFNAAYGIARQVSEDIELGRVAREKPQMGFSRDQELEMQGMDAQPDQWDSRIDEGGQRIYTNRQNPQQVKTFSQMASLGGHYFAPGDAQAERLARQRRMADVSGKYNARVGLDMHSKLDAAQRDQATFARQQKQWGDEDTLNALSSAVMGMSRQQLDDYMGQVDFGSLGLPNLSVQSTPDGYQFLQMDDSGNVHPAMSLDVNQMKQLALAHKLSEAGLGKHGMGLYDQVFSGLKGEQRDFMKMQFDLAQGHNQAQGLQHRKDDSDRRFGLEVQEFRHRQGMDHANLALRRQNAAIRAAAMRASGNGGAKQQKAINFLDGFDKRAQYQAAHDEAIKRLGANAEPQKLRTLTNQLYDQSAQAYAGAQKYYFMGERLRNAVNSAKGDPEALAHAFGQATGSGQFLESDVMEAFGDDYDWLYKDKLAAGGAPMFLTPLPPDDADEYGNTEEDHQTAAAAARGVAARALGGRGRVGLSMGHQE